MQKYLAKKKVESKLWRGKAIKPSSTPRPPMTRHTAESLTATLEARREVLLHIEWDRPDANGETIERTRHATCEDAWMTFRLRTKTESRRRSRKDRRHAYRAVYVGCTSTDKTYGGWLHNGGSSLTADDFLDDRKRSWKRELIGLLYIGA